MTELYADHVLQPSRGGHVVGPATITLAGNTIVDVQPGRRETAEVVRGLVAPAWVNAHTHLSMSAFRGIGGLAVMRGNVVEDLYYRLESNLRPEDVKAFTTIAAAESLLAGVGTVWDHYYHGRQVADACATAGLTAVITPTLQDLEGPGVRMLEAQIADTLEIHEDAALREVGVVAGFGPHATDTVSATLWERVATLCSEHELPFHAHAAQSIEEYRRAQERHGVSPIRWLRDNGWIDAAPSALLVHALYADRADLEGLDPERVAMAFCPASQIQYCFPAFTRGWRELGMRVVVATDAGACNDTMNVQQELRLTAGGPLFGVTEDPSFTAFWQGTAAAADDVALRREALQRNSELGAGFLLSTILENPGTLHPDLKVGAIAPGFHANLVVYDLEHPCFWPGNDILRALALQDVAPAIQRMMTSGRWLSAHGEHRRAITQADWLAQAVSHARGCLGRYLPS